MFVAAKAAQPDYFWADQPILLFVLFFVFVCLTRWVQRRAGFGAGTYKGEEYAEIIPPEETQSYVPGYQSQEDSNTSKSKKTREDRDKTLVSWGFVVAQRLCEVLCS
jgi:hypothetical protein